MNTLFAGSLAVEALGEKGFATEQGQMEVLCK